MSSIKHKPCYGTMLPHGQSHHHADGKVFKLQEVGPVGMMVRARVVETDIAEWDDCRNCEEFQPCYQLCMAVAERFTTPNMRLLKERHGFDTVGSRELCLELASLPDHCRVLDVGTSTGWMAIMLAAHGHQVVGIDVDGDALASATKLAYQFGPDVADRISFLPGNAIALPFEAESFDGVFSFESLHHFPNCRNALDEMLRVCRAGGVLVIADLNEQGREVVREAIATLTGKIHEVNACRLQEVEQLTQHLGTMQRHDGPFLSIFVIKK